MKTVQIRGERLKAALAHAGLRQKDFAAKVGLTVFRVSALCRAGVHHVKESTARAIMQVIGEDVFDANAAPSSSNLTSAETEILAMFRRLSALDQARALLEMEKRCKPG